MIKIYTYKNCSTCQKALKYLDNLEIPYKSIPIRETPPTKTELKKMLQTTGDLKKLFNTSGKDYRELNIKEKLPTLSEKDAIELLAENGNLIKRPFLISSEIRLVGFKPEIWDQALNS